MGASLDELVGAGVSPTLLSYLAQYLSSPAAAQPAPEVNAASNDSTINGSRVDMSKWPTDADVALSRGVDNAYGTPAAGFTEAGVSKTREVPLPKIPAEARRSFEGFENYPLKTTTPEQADRVYRQWLAAQRSPTASLGFNPHRTVSSPQEPDRQLTVAGIQDPKTDVMWYDRNHEDAAVHEAIHRGITLLKNSGFKLPYGNEEMLTRGLMLRHFGELEKRKEGIAEAGNSQVQQAQQLAQSDYFKRALDAIEAAAAQMYARKGGNETVRGPK